MPSPDSSALVVHSGGADSTICLHWALERFDHVQAITFDYGQRHKVEIEAATTICERLGIEQVIVPIDSFRALGGNALVDHEAAIEVPEKGLPSTFVPGRNLIFLTLAAARAWSIGADHIITGVCQTDFSGYPDCREDTIAALQQALRLGIEQEFTLHTPLMHLDKAQSIALAKDMPGCLDSLAWSHTCYEGQVPPCGHCPSCVLRAKGFVNLGVPDPLLVRLSKPHG